MSIANGIFLILPVFCWFSVKTFNMLRQLTKFETWFWIGGIEFLVSFWFFSTILSQIIEFRVFIQVLSFFDRFYLSGLLLTLLAYEYFVLKGSLY